MGWGEPNGSPRDETPTTGTTGQIEAARAALHAQGLVGDHLADEAQLAAARIIELQRGAA